jgi:hypothetical protein
MEAVGEGEGGKETVSRVAVGALVGEAVGRTCFDLHPVPIKSINETIIKR